MNCKQAEQSILLQDSGELGLIGRSRLSRHLRTCADCRSLQADMALTRQALRTQPVPALAAQARAALIEAATPDRRNVITLAPQHRPVSWWRPALAAAALAALVWAGRNASQRPAPVVVAESQPTPAAPTLNVDDAVDAEMNALQSLLLASLEDGTNATSTGAMDEETLATELLALLETP